MDLKSRLSFYRSSAEKTREESAHPVSPASDNLKLKQIEENAEILFPHRPVVKISKSVPATFPAGQLSLTNLARQQFPEINIERLLFFDLETTGLSGGTGSFAFLLGFGFIADGHFHTEQFFLPDFGHEADLFQFLTERYKNFTALVSFNGKSFDAPLLKTRFNLNRFQPFFETWPHLDIFHLSRRIWKDSFPSCSLQSLERELFQTVRHDDIPGEQIPTVYFDFLQSGRTEGIRRILRHNFEDIVSMEIMLTELSGIENKIKWPQLDPPALLRLAVLAGQNNKTGWLEELADLSHKMQFDDRAEISWLLSLNYKRNGNFDRAAVYWKKLTEDHNYAVPAQIELAKFYEHRGRNYNLALSCTETALKHIDLKLELGESTEAFQEIRRNLVIRRRRIIQKSA
jgi:uncharacterized protein YprB with RNaseH-like and TPR domain